MTAFDALVDNCFYSLEIVPHKRLFIEAMFALCNFLTSCSFEQLVSIRNENSLQLLVQVLEQQDIILKTKNGIQLIFLVLETLERLFENDQDMSLCKGTPGLKNSIEKFQSEYDGPRLLTILEEQPNGQIQQTSKMLLDKYFQQSEQLTDLNFDEEIDNHQYMEGDLCSQEKPKSSEPKPQKDLLFSQQYQNSAFEDAGFRF